jgi:hypothetical protein
MLAALVKARLNTENIKRLHLLAVRHTTDEMSRLCLYPWAQYEQLSILYYTKPGMTGLGCKKTLYI